MRDRIYLAALLHDIGKFYQRSDEGNVKTSSKLDDFVKNLESVFCPLGIDQSRSHKHVLWTAQFLEDYRQVFLSLNPEADWHDLSINDSLLHLASSHHLGPDQLSEAGKIIREADHLSSGMDRSSSDALKDDQVEIGRDAFKKIRMTSIFEAFQIKDTIHKYHLPVEAVSLNKRFFPSTHFEGDADYAALWEKFSDEFKFIQSTSAKAFSETFLYLLYKYTSTVPSSTINFPDVSLYDHLKTTAAIAVCLYDWSKGTKAGEDEFLMIGGDFSGIQNYIYSIISENAAKNLKGRSFYLKLLSDSVVMYLLKKLNLYEANIIYNSGGSFYILAPNTNETRQNFENAVHDIEDKIFKSHGTSIYVAIEAITMGRDALLGANKKSIADCWEKLFEARDARKRTRYTERLIQDYSTFFEPGETGGMTVRDAITGEEIQEPVEKNGFTLDGSRPDGSANGVISELTWKQIKLGRELKKAELWVISEGKVDYWPERESINPAGLGYYFYFLSRKDVERKQGQLKASADCVKIITINGNHNGDCDFLNSMLQGTNNIYGFEFFGGNDYPIGEDESPKSFDQLAGDSGFKRLGILRMDVDNLGKIFQEGFGENRSSFSRYAALSRSFDWFFKGYLNTLWKENFSTTTYIVYSGGDDLFIVGRWNDCIAFAELIRSEFKQYVCGNPKFTLSGGIAVVTPKFPIKRGAQESEEAEKLAKAYCLDKDEKDGRRKRISSKDAFTILGIALGWEYEYPRVRELKNEIQGIINVKTLNKSFISKLNLHYLTAKFDQEKLVSPKTYWMTAYDFGRMESSVKPQEVKSFLKKCRLDIVSDTVNGAKVLSRYHSFKLWHLATRWAELENRTL
ncbi:MAG TPA: type III-A CRISPR-associated protein Cas10/Csm1 [Syntrophorhabdus sp.]|nr:type III-A CRISPR-associated protein Cas10/Csm1 [Syntrophorhabdus sp.]